jgi:mRNA-degrading endonuclease RelE of RelBE toxin-antitoxin system
MSRFLKRIFRLGFLVFPLFFAPIVAFGEYLPSSSRAGVNRCEGALQGGRTETGTEAFARSLQDVLNFSEVPKPDHYYVVDPQIYPELFVTIKKVVFHKDFVKEVKKSGSDDQRKFFDLIKTIQNGEVSGEGQNGLKRPNGVMPELRMIKKIRSGGKHRIIAVVKGGVLFIVEGRLNDEIRSKDYLPIGKRVTKKVENLRSSLN